MAYEPVLIALADPTRRAILDQLRPGPLSVAQIAEPLPVSRPAVSQHLKVMKDAGLLTVEKIGTRNLYALAPSGLDAMKAWLEGLWEDALAAHARAATQHATDTLLPVTKSLHVRMDPPEAFALFTEDIALWWPVATHSRSAENGALPMALVFHTGPEGRIEETLVTGEVAIWADVTAWVPSQTLGLTWRLSHGGALPTQIAVRFDGAGRGTKITLIHSGWDAAGDEASALRDMYDAGWSHIFLERFSAAAAAALSNF